VTITWRIWKIFGLPSARVVIWMIERHARRNATADPARAADILKRTAALRERLKSRGDRTLMPEHHALAPCHQQPGRQGWHLRCALRHPFRFARTRSAFRRVVEP
jgi:hypothetical protein